MKLFETTDMNIIIRESVREVMKCLGKKNFEFMYYERKLCFLQNMLVCNNSITSCMMPMYMQSNEYIQLCERCM